MTLDAAELADLEARTWIDGQGRELPWRAMSIAHLRNVANYLRRNAAERIAAAERLESIVHSEAAEDAARDLVASAEIAAEDDGVTADALEAYAAHRETSSPSPFDTTRPRP